MEDVMENIDNNETESNAIIKDEAIQVEAIEEVIQNTDEENDFLKSLDDDSDLEGVKADSSLGLAQGKASAVGLLAMGECLVQQFGHKSFALDPTQKKHVSESFAPLFVKYGGELPPWLLQYKEEIAFTFAMGTLCFTSYSQVKALKKVDAEKVVNKAEKVSTEKQEKEGEADATLQSE